MTSGEALTTSARPRNACVSASVPRHRLDGGQKSNLGQMAFVSCQEGDVNMGKQVLAKLLASKYCWL